MDEPSIAPAWTGERIIGAAGAGLDNATWAKNQQVADIGQEGEHKAAEALARMVASTTHTVVLHDLAIPIPGFSANIDHVVCGGNSVLIVDSKAWAAGTYVTLPGYRTYRSFRRFKPAEKHTMSMASDALERFLEQRNVAGIQLDRPIVVVWPTSRQRPNTTLLRVRGAKTMLGSKFARRAHRLVPDEPVPAGLVVALSRLTSAPVQLPPTSQEPANFDPPPGPATTAPSTWTPTPSDDVFDQLADDPGF